MKKLLLALAFCLGSFAFAQNPADSAFSKIYVSIEGGEMYPFGDLIDAVQNSFYGGVGFRYNYWSDVDGFVQLALGAGFTCNWTRADYDGEEDYFTGRGGMLLDNETEFGWFARLNMPFLYYKSFTIGLDVLWEQLWTLPERSNTLTVGVYVERSVW